VHHYCKHTFGLNIVKIECLKSRASNYTMRLKARHGCIINCSRYQINIKL